MGYGSRTLVSFPDWHAIMMAFCLGIVVVGAAYLAGMEQGIRGATGIDAEGAWAPCDALARRAPAQ